MTLNDKILEFNIKLHERVAKLVYEETLKNTENTVDLREIAALWNSVSWILDNISRYEPYLSEEFKLYLSSCINMREITEKEIMEGEMSKSPENKNVHIYYIRDSAGRPETTVAIGWEKVGKKTLYSRGLAVCSLEDQFNKRRGQDIAIGRMTKAQVNKESSLPMRDLGDVGTTLFKSAYNIDLTEDEKRMLTKPTR